MFDPKSPIRANILGLEPYRCARDDFKEGVLLDANENTLGPALVGPTEEEELLALNRYPDPHQSELKQQIVDFRNANPNAALDSEETEDLKLTPANLVLGVGSDESIDMLIRCCCQPAKEKILICPPTYGMYLICAIVNDVEVVKVPLLAPSFQLDVQAVIEKVRVDPLIKLLYLTSPGNPTGKLLDVKDVIDVVEQTLKFWKGYVIVDEAYIDFTEIKDGKGESTATLVNKYQNLVTLQTLSKSFGLAGIRLGVTFANETLSKYLNSMKYPYNISSLTSNVAIRATGEGLNQMKKFVDNIVTQRAVVLDELTKTDGIGRNLGGLDLNFLLLEILDKHGNPSNAVAQELYTRLAVENKVVVRFRGKELNCEGCLRMTIGTAEENAQLVRVIQQVLPELRK